MKSRNFFPLFAAVSLSCFFSFSLYAEVDTYFLEKEIQETQRKIDPIADSLIRMEMFLRNYPQQRADLETVYNEFLDYEKKMRGILQNNLVKSTITLGFETASKASFAAGLAGAALSRIALECATEVAGDLAQNSYSQGTQITPYKRSVKKLSEQATAVLPEIQKFQWELSLKGPEWNAYMRMTKEFGDDDETAIIYRRFQYALDGLEKYRKRIDEIIAEMKETKARIEQEMPVLQKELDGHIKRKNELWARLSAALKEKKQAEIDAKLEEAQQKAGQQALPLLPPLTPSGNKDADYLAWTKKYDAAAAIFEKEMPALAESIAKERETIREELAAANSRIEAQGIFMKFSVPDLIDPSVDRSAAQIVEWHVGTKKGPEVYAEWQALVGSVRGDLAKLQERAAGLTVKEKRYSGLVDMGNAIDLEGKTVLGGGIDPQRNILGLFSRLVPGYVNFSRNLTGLELIESASSADADLARVEGLLPLAIETCDKNEKILSRMFDAKMSKYETVRTQMSETWTNMENAFSQMEGSAAAYEKLAAGTGCAVKREAPSSEFYFSASKGGLTSVLGQVFSRELFAARLKDALNAGDLRGAEDLMNKYREFLDKAEDLNSKYTKGWGHFDYYAQMYGTLDRPILADMDTASRVSNAYLKAPAMTEKDREMAAGGLTKFADCFRSVPEFPKNTFDPSSAGDKAIKLFELLQKIEKESGAWAGLDKDAFAQKMKETEETIKKTAEGGGLDQAAGRALELLARARNEWNRTHPDVPEPGGEGSGRSGVSQGSGQGTPPASADPKQLVAESVRRIAEAYERKDLRAFSEQVARDFSGNRSSLEEGVRMDFDLFDSIRLGVFMSRVDERGGVYTAEVRWEKTQYARKTGKEQRTSGSTNFIYQYEDGALKLKNLRGNLIFATLSPEIAESCGLPSSVVEEIRRARDNRDPVQPGAEKKDDGGASGPAQPVEAGTFALTQHKLPHPPDFDIEGYNFAGRNKTRETFPFPVQSDFRRREGWLETRSGGGIQDLGSVPINEVSEAPASGYMNEVGGRQGHTYAIKLMDGTYALVETSSLADVYVTPNTSNFKYKYQRSGSRSFK